MKRTMQIESMTRSTFCATNFTNLQLDRVNTIRMAFVKLVAACGFEQYDFCPDGKISYAELKVRLIRVIRC